MCEFFRVYSYKSMEYPKIYGFKTPEKHMFDPPEHWERVENWFSERNKMKIVEFYRGERGNQNGHMLEDIVTNWTDGMLEMDHDYVQWLFPSNERSMLNGEAPTLTREESKVFEADPELREKVKQSFVRFLNFLGFKLSRDDDVVLIEPKDENLPWWLRNFNHTMLRVTRMLKCLRLTGNTRYANTFFDTLRAFKSHVSPNTWQFWHDAVFHELWPEPMKL